MRAAFFPFSFPVPRSLSPNPCLRRHQCRHHSGRGRADPDRDPGFLRRERQRIAIWPRYRAGGEQRSGALGPVLGGRSAKPFVQDADSLLVAPRFADWRVLNAQALVVGRVEAQTDGRLKVEFRLWDVFAEQQMTGLAYFTMPNNWRRVAHIVADAIYKRITGEEGYFDTRIVYIAETGPATNAHQAPRDHGSGRRKQPHSVGWPRDGSDAALLADHAANHLHGLLQQQAARLSVQYRHRAAASAGRFRSYDLCAALFARRQPRGFQPFGKRRFQHLHDGSAFAPHPATDHRRCDQHRALLFAGRAIHHVSNPTAAARSRFMSCAPTAAMCSASASATAITARPSGRRAAI